MKKSVTSDSISDDNVSPDSINVRQLIGDVAARDDKTAAERLLDIYSPLIDSMASSFSRERERCGAVLEKDDLRQEASIALLRAAKTFKLSQDKVTFGLYAKICIRNGLISALRRADSKGKASSDFMNPREFDKSRDAADETEAMSSGPADNPLDRIIEKESYETLMNFLSEVLSGLEKSVLGCYLDGKTYLETAKLLSVSEKTVDNAVYRIKTKLRKLL